MDSSHGNGIRHITVLPEQVYQRIAAGEVIDRPASVVRELIDNAVDAGSSTVDVYVDKGGTEEIRVVDNGSGMTPEDLQLSILPHATSKVSSADDLQTITSLGFRGEALASIAASGRLEIVSRAEGFGEEARRILVESGIVRKNGVSRGRPGTTVTVRDLFYSLPGRKQFLKQPSTEQKMCRQVFIEKALPFTDIYFRFFADGAEQLSLPPSSLLERGRGLFSRIIDPKGLIEKNYFESGGLSLRCLLGHPELFRRDRRYIYIYINNRRVDEYAFLQAVEYGYGDYLPKGRFPCAFVLITLPPGEVDFNIHPAKREVRLKNLQSIHRSLQSFIRSSLLEFLGGMTGARGGAPGIGPPSDSVAAPVPAPEDADPRTGFIFPEPERRHVYSAAEVPGPTAFNAPSAASGEVRFIGQVFSLFLLASVGETLYIIDQHAAHERYLFDRINAAPPRSQQLLVPLRFETDPGTSEFVRVAAEVYQNLGIGLREEEENRWLLTALPALAGVTGGDIIDFVVSEKGDEQLLRKELYAKLACHAAVQDGDLLDTAAAVDVIQKALSLPVPRCPHGRPVWHTITRDRLFSLLGRKV
jgi:DNA mismatch repair protein MutL